MSRPDEVTALRLAQELVNADPVIVELSAFDAWTVLAIVQFASRHPRLTTGQHELMVSFGRGLQAAVTERVPFAAEVLERGWDPEHDVPIDDTESAGGSSEPGGER